LAVATTSSLENPQISNSNGNIPSELPKSPMTKLSTEVFPAKCECQCHQKRQDAVEESIEVEKEVTPKSSLDLLCTRLDATNKILEKIAEMIAQRLPPPSMPNGNGIERG